MSSSGHWFHGRLTNAFDLLELTRPQQWYKQSLLFVGITFSGKLLQVADLATVVVGAAAFCAAAGSTYTFNDVADADADRRHPRKRHRPVASGRVGPRPERSGASAPGAAGTGQGEGSPRACAVREPNRNRTFLLAPLCGLGAAGFGSRWR